MHESESILFVHSWLKFFGSKDSPLAICSKEFAKRLAQFAIETSTQIQINEPRMHESIHSSIRGLNF